MIRSHPKWFIPPIIFLVSPGGCKSSPCSATPCSSVELSIHGAHESWMQSQSRKDNVTNIHALGSCMTHVYMKRLQLWISDNMTWMLIATFKNASLTIYHVYHNCSNIDVDILITHNMQPFLMLKSWWFVYLQSMSWCGTYSVLQTNSNLYKTNGIKIFALLCIVATVCVQPAHPTMSTRIKCAFCKQAWISERCRLIELHTNTSCTQTICQFRISNASSGQDKCNDPVIAEETDLLPVLVLLAFVLHPCFNMPSWTYATIINAIGSKNSIHHSLTQGWCPETPQNDWKKPPDPEKPEICPKTAFPQEKNNTGRGPVQKPIFPRFRTK